MNKQLKQVIITLGSILLAVIGLVWLGGGFKSEAPTASINENYGGALTIEESNYDFGTVSMANGKVSKDFVLENQSQDNVKIGEVYTSCMCTEAEVKVGDKIYGPFGMPGHLSAGKANAVISPGEKVIVKAIFDPAAHGPSGVGPIERQISVDAGAKEPIILGFKAVVTP